MAIIFDASTKRIILDSASVTATELYSRWVDWAATSDNLKYGMVFRQVGSDDLGGGLSIPPYYFLQDAWRVRPMESNHNLTITGNLFVEGGGVPVVFTLGTYQVNVNYTVPVQAQGISTSGSSGPTAEETANAVWLAVSRTLTEGGSGSGITVEQAAHLMAIPSNPLLTTDIRLDHLDADISSITGSSSLNSTQNDKLMALGTPTEIVTTLMNTPLPASPTANTFGDLIKNKILTIFRFNTYK